MTPQEEREGIKNGTLIAIWRTFHDDHEQGWVNALVKGGWVYMGTDYSGLNLLFKKGNDGNTPT